MQGDGTAGAIARLGEFGAWDALPEEAHRRYVDGFCERAVAAARSWRVLTDAAGDLVSSRYLRYTEAIALQELGRHAESVTVAEALLADLTGPAGAGGHDGAADPVWRAKALAVLAESSTRLGEHRRAVAAVAEADWLVDQVEPGTYGHLSASMAVALALRSMHLFEQADERLRTVRPGPDTALGMLLAQERALLSAQWGATLGLVGQHAAARGHLVEAASRARLMRRAAHHAHRPHMAARAEVVEAFACMGLGEPDLAAARAAGVAGQFPRRAELVESHLLDLVLGHADARAGRSARARERLSRVAQDAHSAGRDTWAAVAMELLADVDTDEHGRHPAVRVWKTVARAALARVWSEREGRFAAVQDHHQVRVLTAETDRMGRVVLQDPLTGLGNRRALLAAVERSGPPCSVLFVDVDDFKQVNDTFSHAVGDDVLREVARILRTHCRAQDVLVRYGGDEFVVLTSAGREAAESVAYRLHDAVRTAPWAALARGLFVTVSVGVGHTAGAAGEDPMRAADAALAAAKRAGRDRVVPHLELSPAHE